MLYGSLFLLGCRSYTIVPEQIKASFTFRNGDSLRRTGLVPKTKGYYRTAHSAPIPHYTKPFDRDKITYTPDTVYDFLIFYDDGTVLNYGLYHHDTIVLETFRKVITDPNTPLSRGFYAQDGWGQYRMFQDTIKVQYIHRPVQGMMSRVWSAWEEQFIILDETTVRAIGKDGLLPGYFISSSTIPPPDCWLKKEDWFMGTH